MLQLRNPFYIGFSFAHLQKSGSFPEGIERLHNSVIGLAKTFVMLDYFIGFQCTHFT